MKLSEQHLTEVYRLSALGNGATQIARLVGQGLKVEGSNLPAITIDESAVRWRLRQPEGKAQVSRWREKLYGNVYDTAGAWLGHRVEALNEVLANAREQAISSADPSEARQWSKVAISAASELRAEMNRVEVSAPSVSVQAHVSRNGNTQPGNEGIRRELMEKLMERAHCEILLNMKPGESLDITNLPSVKASKRS